MEIGGDISFAIDNLENEANRLHTLDVLRESEEKYKVVADNTFDWEYWVSPKDEYLYMSPSCKRISGYDVEDFNQPNFMADLVLPEDLPLFLEHKRQHHNLSNDFSQVEFRIIRSDGEVRWISHTCRRIVEENRFLGRRASNRDITEQKAHQKEARISFSRLRQSFKEVINALSIAIEMRDPYTSGHQLRVANLATAIAKELKLDENVVEGIQIAGIVHDIGKLSIPAEILSKPGQLKDIEYMLIKSHPTTGHDILSKIDFPWPIAEIVYQHHERINGSGYPRSLTGDNVLLEAKILCVADVIEAMSSHRPYRPSLGVNAALIEINEHKGTLFDAEVVEACNRVFSSGEFSFDQVIS